jgi:protein-S-isoprenylcysteine O-methyltransferase Ste14
VLARLGFVGLSIWLLFIGFVLVRFARFLRMRTAPEGVNNAILWLFLCFVLFLEISSVQPELEFSHGTIPFYFLLGLGLGIMRNMKNNPNAGSVGARALRTWSDEE